MCFKTITKHIILASLILAFFLPQSSYASTKGFMTLPFEKEPVLMQGWNYNFGNRLHQGIDYYSPVGRNLLATAEGYAKSGYQPGKNFVYGRYLILDHRNGYKTLYAHLSEINCSNICDQGTIIGKSGMSGTDNEHLHLEVLSSIKYGNGLNRGYGWRIDPYDIYSTANFYPPNKGYRGMGENNIWKGNYPGIFVPPPTPQKLTLVSSGQGGAELSWDECADGAFEMYELYRSETEGEKGEKIFSSADSKSLTFKDSGLFASQNYFYTLTTFYKDGRTADSNTINVNTPRETINISNKTGIQRYVGISRDKVYWEDTNREQTNFPEKKTFYYYDLSEKVVKTISIGDPLDNRIQGPYKPQIAGDWLCYYGKKSRYGNNEVFCRNLAAGNMSADIQISLGGGENLDPQISEEGILVWKGGGNGRLLWANLNEGTEIHELTATTVLGPRIWGKNIIYHEKESGSTYALWIINQETGEKRLLKAGVGSSTSDIWEDEVVFTRAGKVYIINLNNPENETLVAETTHNNARIRDGKVVYSRSRQEGGSIIYVYLISSGKTLTLTDPLKNMPMPVILENLVAYDALVSDSSVDMDIFLTYL